MPGRFDNSNCSYMTSMDIYRIVSTADTLTQSSVNALEDYIAMSNSPIMYNNALLLGLLADDSDEYTLSVYGNMSPLGADLDNNWCLVHTQDFTGAAAVTLRDIPPVSIKVMISGTFSNPVTITYMKSASPSR